MQTCSLKLRLAGSNDMIVDKTGVTPAEYLLLVALHGADGAVSDLKLTGDVNRTGPQEVDRLMQTYGRQRELSVGQSENPSKNGAAALIRQSFGGLRPNVPMTFAEIGVELESATPAASRRGGRKPAGEQKAEAELTELMQ